MGVYPLFLCFNSSARLCVELGAEVEEKRVRERETEME